MAEKIHMRIDQISEADSVEMLVRHIQNKDLSPEKVILGVSLVERESVRRLG